MKNSHDSETILFFYSPFLLVLLSSASALQMTGAACGFLYVTTAVAGLWYTGGLWLKEHQL
jgi:hypothetical protein